MFVLWLCHTLIYFVTPFRLDFIDARRFLPGSRLQCRFCFLKHQYPGQGLRDRQARTSEKDSTWPSGSEWLLPIMHIDSTSIGLYFVMLSQRWITYTFHHYNILYILVSALWFCLAFLRSGGENGPDACWKTQVFSAFLCQPPKAAASVTQCSIGYLLSVLIGWLCDFL